MTHHCTVVSSQIRSQLTTHEFVAVAGDESDLSFKLLIDHSQFSDIVKKRRKLSFSSVSLSLPGVRVSVLLSAFEMSVVRWIPDREVPACMTCVKSFGLMTRRHHCRLCGGIICDKCSQFLTHSFARKFSA